MTVFDLLDGQGSKWDKEPPAERKALEQLTQEAGVSLPEDYLTFLAYSNGGEGELGINPGWFSL